MKKFNVTSKLHLILILTFVGSLISNSTASADNQMCQANFYQKCSEAIYPFNVAGPTSFSVNDLNCSVSENECLLHQQGNFPNNQHKPTNQVNDPVPPNTNVKVVTAVHEHHFINESTSVNDTVFKEAWVRKFKIILQPDLLAALKQGSLQCPVPDDGNPAHYDVGFQSCNHTNDNIFGGTKVEWQGNTILYTFGLHQPQGGYKPIIPGINPEIDEKKTDNDNLYFYNDTTDPHNRAIGFPINFDTNDLSISNPTGWTATSTSQAEILDAVIPKAAYFNPSNAGGKTHSCADAGYTAANSWCNVNSYHWVDIGTDVSVWKPTQPASCQALTLTAHQNNKDFSPINTNGLVSNQPMTFTVVPSFNPQNQVIPLKYKWSAILTGVPQGNFKDNTVNDPNQPADGSFIDDDTLVYYTGGPQNTIITVNALNLDNTTTPCAVSLILPAVPELVCNSVKIIDPVANPLNANANQPFSQPFTVQSNPPSSQDLQYQWTTSNNQGTFNNQPSGFKTQNTQTNFSVQNPVDGMTVTVKAVDKNGQPYANPLCSDSRTIHVPGLPGEVCDDSQFNLLSTSSLPLSPNQSTIFRANGKNKPSSSPVAMMQWTATAGTLTAMPTIPNDITQQLQCIGTVGANTFLTVPSFCSVSFSGGPAGTKVSVSSFPPENDNSCKRNTVVEGQVEQKPYCTGIDLNPNELNKNGTTDLTAKVSFSDGNSYDTTVQWDKTNGSYSDAQVQTKKSNYTFTNTFTQNNSNSASVSVKVIDVPDFYADNSDICQTGKTISAPQTEECKELDLYEKNDQICIHIVGDYNGKFSWEIDGNALTPSYDTCKPLTPNTSYYVEATSETQCHDSLTPKIKPPTFEKRVSVGGKNKYTKTVSIAPKPGAKVDYKLTFTAHSPNTDATIIDGFTENTHIYEGISDGKIIGETNPIKMDAGEIDYIESSMQVTGNGIKECNPKSKLPKVNCYEGDIGHGGVDLYKVDGEIQITYQGQVNDSAINSNVCKNGKICQEKYSNVAKAEYIITDSSSHILESNRLESDALVQIFCQYILTRAAGDIYLESDLNAGVDIRKCSKFTTSTGVIITPAPPPPVETPSTGLPTTIFEVNHEICSEGQAGTLPAGLENFYGQTVSEHLSSNICEVKLQPGLPFQKLTIARGVEESKTRLSRWAADYDCKVGGCINNQVSLSQLISDAPNKKVYHVKNGDLIVDQTFTLYDGQGAKTIIIENGNFIMNHDILYGACNKAFCNVLDTASLAIIGLNSGAYIDPNNVHTASGVYFFQEGDANSPDYVVGSGKLFSGQPGNSTQDSYEKLDVYGSVYGDIEPLFEKRLFSGDPENEDGGIVIHFDERIILNTPLGLRDVLNLTETETA